MSEQHLRRHHNHDWERDTARPRSRSPRRGDRETYSHKGWHCSSRHERRPTLHVEEDSSRREEIGVARDNSSTGRHRGRKRERSESLSDRRRSRSKSPKVPANGLKGRRHGMQSRSPSPSSSHRKRRRRSRSYSTSSSSNSSDASSQSRSHNRDIHGSKSKYSTNKDRKRDKDKKHKKKHRRRVKDVRRSVLTGKKIKLKVHKDKDDIERDSKREELLQFLNSAYE